jgi:UDP-N-acetylmuramate--alanine ligase
VSNSTQHIYFLGIGGIGMSALARYFFRQGDKISGYDKTESELTRALSQEGMYIHYSDSPELIPSDIDYVIYTPAIPGDQKELIEIKRRGLTLKKRAQVLGEISRRTKCLAVAGTHGKTTTSTLLSHLLRESGIDVTAFVGGISANYNSNYLIGSSDYMVAEADEFDRSFLQLSPLGLIITSCDPDHLDIYGSGDAVQNSFNEFLNKIGANGFAVVKHGLPLTFNADSESRANITTYGIDAGENYAYDIVVRDGAFCFNYKGKRSNISNLELSVPGRHNVENAVAAITLALEFGATESGIRAAIKSFKGVQRRFEFIYKGSSSVVIDDYAHHPAELKAAITAARDLFPGRKISGMFQPHLYSRTRDFEDGFAESLSLLDEVILLDIYPARELPIPGVSSDNVLSKITAPWKQKWKYSDVVALTAEHDFDVLLIMGAGDIDRLVRPVANVIAEKGGVHV